MDAILFAINDAYGEHVMASRLAYLVLAVASFPLCAMNIGSFSQERNNSDIMTITLTSVDSTHPQCQGHKEAVADIYDRRLQRSFPHARGCWFSEKDGYIPVHLWTFSGGDEFTASINLNEIKFTSEFDAAADKYHQKKTSLDKNAENAAPLSTERLIEDAVLFGSCAVMFHAEEIAKTPQEKALAAKLRVKIAGDGKIKIAEVDQHCRSAIDKTMDMVRADSEKVQ